MAGTKHCMSGEALDMTGEPPVILGKNLQNYLFYKQELNSDVDFNADSDFSIKGDLN